MLVHKRFSIAAGCLECITEEAVNRGFSSQIFLALNSYLKIDRSGWCQCTGLTVLATGADFV